MSIIFQIYSQQFQCPTETELTIFHIPLLVLPPQGSEYIGILFWHKIEIFFVYDWKNNQNFPIRENILELEGL